MTTLQMRQRVVQLIETAAGFDTAERSGAETTLGRRRLLAEAVQRLRNCGLLFDDSNRIDVNLWRLLADPERRFMLVYQGGIANVFEVDCFNLNDYGRNAKRLHQGTFTSSISFAHGLGAAGGIVRTASCNIAGDCSTATWEDGVEGTPFRDDVPDVRLNGGAR